VFWFSLLFLSEVFLILKQEFNETLQSMYNQSTSKVPLILVRFECKLNFPYRFSKNTRIANFMKIHPVWAEMLHEDRRTDRETCRS